MKLNKCSIYYYQDIGITAAISEIGDKNHHVSGSPFSLLVTPGAPFGPYSEAMGSGLLGGIAGEKNYFIVSYKDEFKNPTTNMNYLRFSGVLQFMDVLSKNSPLFSTVTENLESDFFKLSYNVTRAGTYIMEVYVQITEYSRLLNGSLGKNGNLTCYVLLHFY